MSRRRKLFLWFLPAFLVLGLAGLMYTLLHTAPGARWAWSQAVQNVPGQMQAAAVSGSLRRGLLLSDVVYSDDSVTAEADRLELRLAFDIFPPAIHIEHLEANEISLVISDSSSEDPSDRPTGQAVSELSLPLPLSFSSVRVGQLLILDDGGEELIGMSAIRLQADWFRGLEIRQAVLNTGALAWRLDGAVDFAAPFPVNGTVHTYIPAGSGGLDFPADMNIEGHIEGSLLAAEFEIRTDLGGLDAAGTVRDLLEVPDWALKLTSPRLGWPLGGDDPDFYLSQLVADVSGQALDYQLQAVAQFDASDLPISNVDLTAEGNTEGLHISELNVSSELVDLEASGPLSWADELRFTLSTQLNRIDPGFWMDDWPENYPLGGTLELAWRDDSLWLENMALGAEESPFEITGDANYDPYQDLLSADLGWRSLRWPLTGGPADFESPSGRVEFSGRTDDWTASGQLELRSADWPSGVLQLTARGGAESLEITVKEGQVLGGRFAGEFSYQWSGSQPWSARVDASNLDLSSMSEGLSGQVNARLEARGQASPLAFDVDIRQLDGRVNGRAVSAQGALVVEAGNWRAKGLNIRSGESYLRMDGNLNTEEGLSFSGRIESLAELDEDAAGSLSLDGRVSVNPSHPVLELNAQGDGLVWDGLEAETLVIITETSAGGRIVEIEIPSLLRGEQLIENVLIRSGGTTPLESLRVQAESEGSVLDLELEGAVRNWAQFPDVQWEGVIETFSLRNETLGFLELEQPGPLIASLSALQLQPVCLRGSRDGQACLDFSWESRDHFSSNIRLSQVSLHLAQLLLGSRLEFSQTVNGEVHWQEEHGKKASADVRFTLTPGQVISEDKSATLETGAGLFSFRISEGQLLAGNLDIDLPGSGVIDTDFSVPDISRGVDSAIEGHVRVSLHSIASIMSWIPQLEAANGTVNADVLLAGTITEPKLTGHASLVRGRFEHLATGLSVTDIQLAGAVYDYDYTELNGSFKSGDGRGRIKASVQFDNILKPAITLELAGQDLTLIDIPDMTIKADPDLKLRWQDSALDLNGKVLIPSARIAPRYLPNTAASESEDLVFVGEQPPVLEESYIDRSRLRLNGQVEVALGDDVTVTFQRATAKLSGQSVFTWNNALLPVANGTFLVSGKISAYGQLLEVADGRVSFPGVPADNPHLSINAEREIYGNLQVKKAGVLISGTLKRPVLETYTIPATTQERALTLLVTGHDFDYEQGVGAVEVGMYIAPKLYVSYGVGLFEAQSVISARYDLGKGFGVKATSGQRETGADITYTIEN